jgi:hypothetical protein
VLVVFVHVCGLNLFVSIVVLHDAERISSEDGDAGRVGNSHRIPHRLREVVVHDPRHAERVLSSRRRVGRVPQICDSAVHLLASVLLLSVGSASLMVNISL